MNAEDNCGLALCQAVDVIGRAELDFKVTNREKFSPTFSPRHLVPNKPTKSVVSLDLRPCWLWRTWLCVGDGLLCCMSVLIVHQTSGLRRRGCH